MLSRLNFFFFRNNQDSFGGTAVRPAVRVRTGVALEEAGEPVVAGAAVAVRTVVAVVEPQQLAGAITHVYVAQLEPRHLHVLPTPVADSRSNTQTVQSVHPLGSRT